MADATTETGARALPRVHWGPIAAGVPIALAAHVVLGLVGGALGLAAEPADSGALGAGAAVWALLTPLVSTLVGAWVAVRLARQWDAAGSNLHGVLVWSIGLLAGAIFLTGTLATGAMSAGTAASGNAGALRRAIEGGTQRIDPGSPRTQAGAEQAQDDAGRAGAAALGAAAMASLAGLLGAFLGAALARSRREGQAGRGLGWRIALQRTDERPRVEHPGTFGAGIPPAGGEPARPFGTGPGAGYERRPGEDPYPHH
jgi:hypothetical protein